MVGSVDFYERRPGSYQIILPILHEDGDMIEMYLEDSPRGGNYVRICDHGLALMRLSYTYDVETPARSRIFESILINNGIGNDKGNLFLDVTEGMVYEGVLQFAGGVQKVCSMDYWSRELVRSAFYDDLELYVSEDLAEFVPIAERNPLPEYPIAVDWSLTCNSRELYVFGVRGNDKAKNVAIALLEFQKASLPFISLVVHEDIDELGNRERLYLTKNADTQYPTLEDFREKSPGDIRRLAGMAA